MFLPNLTPVESVSFKAGYSKLVIIILLFYQSWWHLTDAHKVFLDTGAVMNSVTFHMWK